MIYNNFLNLLAKFCVIEKVKYSCFSLVVCDMSSEELWEVFKKNKSFVDSIVMEDF